MRKIILTGLLALLAANVQSAPPSGHPSTEQAAKALGLPAEGTFSHQGRVLQAINSNNYTYIEVARPEGQRLWLAAPRLVVAPRWRIRFGDGTMMNNFYSKKLKRTFARVIFVPAVEVVAQAP